MSTRTRGRAFEIWGKKYLESQGWSVYLCGRRAVFLGPGKLITKGDDIFGCDLVAIKEGHNVRFIQMTVDKHIGKHLAKRLREFEKYHFGRAACVQLWNKQGREVQTFDYYAREAGQAPGCLMAGATFPYHPMKKEKA